MDLSSEQFVGLVLKKEEVDSLRKENKFLSVRNRFLSSDNTSLSRENSFLRLGCVGLAIFGALFTFYTCKTATDLKRIQKENKALSENVTRLDRKVISLFLENQDLKVYRELVDGMEPSYLNQTDSIIEKKEKQNQKDDACKALKINSVKLSRLKERE